MAVTAAQLKSPTGELDPVVLWPGESSADTDARLAAYITDGNTRAAAIADAAQLDKAVIAWSYHRAYQDVATRLALIPASKTLVDQGSTSRTDAQMAAIQKLADDWLAKFNALVPATDAPTPAPVSSSAPNVFKW